VQVRACSPPTFFAPSSFYLLLIPHPQLLIKMSHQIFVASFQSGMKKQRRVILQFHPKVQKMNEGNKILFDRFHLWPRLEH